MDAVWGRNYHDYEVYMEQHPDTAVVQMDSVIGSKGGESPADDIFCKCVTDAGVPAGSEHLKVSDRYL